jgi:hypothetical protein
MLGRGRRIEVSGALVTCMAEVLLTTVYCLYEHAHQHPSAQYRYAESYKH